MMVIPPLMMELLTGNLSIASFFSPVVLLILFIGYSIPVLLLRELSVKWKLGTEGVFILGIIYGIINEGLGAKTLLSSTGLPTPSFNDYGYFGINLSFSAYVLVIQSLVSVVIPIRIVHHFFPEIKGQYWLGNITRLIFAALSILGICLIFFSPYPSKVNPLFFPLFIMVILALASAARSLSRGEEPDRPRIGLLFVGMSFVLIYGIGLDLIANLKVHLVLFFISWAAITLLYSRFFSHFLFGIGVYMLFGITGIINSVVVKGHPEGLACGLLFEAWFVCIAWRCLYKRIVKESAGEH